MRAVTGTVTSSKPISLSKAAAILSRFAAADIGVRRDVAAYLKRASNAFEDLVQFHRELRSSRKRAKLETEQEVEEYETSRSRNRAENSQTKIKLEAEEEGEDRKRKKKKEREDGSLRIEDNGSLMEVEGDHGEGNTEVRKKNKKKRSEEERRDLERNNEVMKAKVKVEVAEEEERLEERKKRKKEKKRSKEVMENGGGLKYDGTVRDGKKRKHLSVEEAARGVEDGSERREMKKKRKAG